MERAAELLGSRSLTVREVAARVGYRQPAQFAKAFRRHHGVAPSGYRDARRFAGDVRRRRLLRAPPERGRAGTARTGLPFVARTP